MTLSFSHPPDRVRTSSTCVGMFALALLLLAVATPAAAVTVTTQITATAGAGPGVTAFSLSVGPATFTPVPDPTIVSVTLSGTLTDVGQDGVSLTPALPDVDGDGIAELMSAFVGLGSLPDHLVDLGTASSVAGAYGPFSAGPFTGLGTIDSLALEFGFTLSPSDSLELIATITIAEATGVPWASSLWLVAGGISALSLWRRR